MTSDEPDQADVKAATPEAVAYWCEETMNTPAGRYAREAARMVHGQPEPEQVLRVAADLWVDQPPGLASYLLDELEYVALVAATQAVGIEIDAERLREHVIDYFATEADAARKALYMLTQMGHDPGHPDPPTVIDPRRPTAADIEAIRAYARNRPPGIELIEAGDDHWYLYTH